jgi:branched-chain amino acid transport system substrate-binding protein
MGEEVGTAAIRNHRFLFGDQRLESQRGSSALGQLPGPLLRRTVEAMPGLGIQAQNGDHRTGVAFYQDVAAWGGNLPQGISVEIWWTPTITHAGTIDRGKVNAALADTDLMTLAHRVKFDENHFNRSPLYFGQWQNTDGPEKWRLEVVYSRHPFVAETAPMIFPIPYQ